MEFSLMQWESQFIELKPGTRINKHQDENKIGSQ